MPTIDDLIVKLNGASVISKLDLKSGYNQIKIDEESRHITAFCTHLGIFQYKRLNFGINASSELFQKAIEHVIAGIDGTININDDIIVSSPNQQIHDQRLDETLNRLSQAGLTLNPTKFEISRDRLDFYGMHFSKNGISLQDSKVQAIKNATTPTNHSDLHSLLGLANYCSMFVPDLATAVNPLRQLLKKKNLKEKWQWLPEHEKALNYLKEKTTTKAFGYFNPSWKTTR
jgi:hypothetical protein